MGDKSQDAQTVKCVMLWNWVSASQGTDRCVDVCSCIQQHFGQIYMATQHSQVQGAQAWEEQKRVWMKATFSQGVTLKEHPSAADCSKHLPEHPGRESHLLLTPHSELGKQSHQESPLCVTQMVASCFCFSFCAFVLFLQFLFWVAYCPSPPLSNHAIAV